MKLGDKIDDLIEIFKSSGIPEETLRTIKENIEREINKIRTLKEPPSCNNKTENDSWYLGPKDTDQFWPKYKELLKKNGWDDQSIEKIDHASTKIISFLEPPGKGKFYTRGLVLGYVQSGKTSNFTAVISKAADIGYRFFIILSGITNSLRNQTQKRLNKDLLDLNRDTWVSLTDVNSDAGFHRYNIHALLTNKAHQKYFCVIKKNSNRLTDLLNWLNSDITDVLKDCPVILIDDEADQASINIGEKNNDENEIESERSKINDLIIRILEKLTKKAYIGYTATPFANILIDPYDENDLYPRDFIISLPKPKDYLGTETIFGRETIQFDDKNETYHGLDIINIVSPEELNRLSPEDQKGSEREAFEPKLTDSLKNAILYFLMASTARFVKENKLSNSTMLIHTTRLKDIQNKFKPILEDFLRKINENLDNNNQNFFNNLENLWDNQHVDSSFIKFDQIYKKFKDISKTIKIIIQNSTSDEDILTEYETNQRPYIIVGGNILSRGLTLEGLIVSFYIRDAKSYDTLLQMGRWFGFHKNYKELIRIWITQELHDFFVHIATVEQEIRYDIQRYEDQNITPLDFSVRIRTHPSLKVTSPLKMRSAVPVDVSYSGKRVETTYFKHKDENWLKSNINAVKNFINKIKMRNIQEENLKSHFILKDIDCNLIIDFLNNYKIHENQKELQNTLIIDYLKTHEDYHKKWNVIIISKSDEGNGTIDIGLNYNVNLINRSKTLSKSQDFANLKGLVSKEDLLLDIPNHYGKPSELSDVEKEFNTNFGSLESIHSAIINYREKKLKGIGLLLIYPISKDSIPKKGDSQKSFALEAVEHVIGIGIYFPISGDENLRYISARLTERRNI